MHTFPLLDLESAWQNATAALAEIETLAATLLADSDGTWQDMATIQGQALGALKALGEVPAPVLEGIAKDWADMREMEERADAASY